MTFNVTLSPENRTDKPTNHPRENSLICAENEKTVTRKELIEAIVTNGRTWSCATLTGKRHTDYFKSLQSIAVDVDNKGEKTLSPEDLIKRAKENGFDVSFIYSTFSDTPEHRKYRAVWILDRVLTDPNAAKTCIETIYNLFPEADNTKDLVRIWFGGKEVLYKTDYILPIEKIDETSLLLKLKGISPSNKSRATKNFRKKNGKALLYTIGESQKSSQFSIDNKLEKYDWKYAVRRSTILQEFLVGEKKIEHPDLYFLATNMSRIKGGEKLYKKSIENNSYINNDKIDIIYYVKNRWEHSPLFPQSFQSLSISHPDYKLHETYKNLLEIRPHHQYSKARVIKPTTTISLEKARIKLDAKLKEALNDEGNNIWVFKLSTGVGKTYQALKLPNVGLFFPTHQLKEEKSNDSQIDHICTPSLPKLPNNIQRQFDSYCKAGLYRKAICYLHTVSEEADGQYFKEDTLLALNNYLTNLESCRNSTEAVYSTHSKGIHTDFTNLDNLIFDEDPLNSLVQIKSCTTKDLRVLAHKLQQKGNNADSQLTKNIADHIKNGIDAFTNNLSPDFQDPESIINILKTDAAIFSLSSKGKIDKESNVYAFLFSQDVKYITAPIDKNDPESDKIIYYITHTPLMEDKKYIILSATANEFIYTKLYGDRVKFVDISNVDLKGQITQFSDKSYSKNSMAKQENNRMKNADKFCTELPLITFKSYKGNFDKPSENLHFWNCSGSNEYLGKDIKVVGTPHINPVVIKLYSKLLGISTNSMDFQFERQKIQHNGIEFNFPTSVNPDIQKLQFHFIEDQLIQSVGRARLVSNDCTVYLFSDYPLPQAKQHSLKETYKYDNNTVKLAA